ncbi:hypothetical protein [Pedobacter jamesrossensis]|uniref:hypothetical protein n=1 Tax=Pedobacter jamesrossensis TaxID=1908238 RepID=UPI00361D4178
MNENLDPEASNLTPTDRDIERVLRPQAFEDFNKFYLDIKNKNHEKSGSKYNYGKADFIISKMLNPIYQPMAGKTINNAENKTALRMNPKKWKLIWNGKRCPKPVIDALKSVGAVVLPEATTAGQSCTRKGRS